MVRVSRAAPGLSFPQAACGRGTERCSDVQGTAHGGAAIDVVHMWGHAVGVVCSLAYAAYIPGLPQVAKRVLLAWVQAQDRTLLARTLWHWQGLAKEGEVPQGLGLG